MRKLREKCPRNWGDEHDVEVLRSASRTANEPIQPQHCLDEFGQRHVRSVYVDGHLALAWPPDDTSHLL
jgi:hypothetical protein